MNELTPAQERYIGFVKELLNEGLDRVERMLGVDRAAPLPIQLAASSSAASTAPVITAPILAAASAAELPKIRRSYKKRSKPGRPRKKAAADPAPAKRSAVAPPPSTHPWRQVVKKITNAVCANCGKRPPHGRSDKCIFCIREARQSPGATPDLVGVSTSTPAQSDGPIRSGQRMPMSGVPIGFAECRCGRIRKSDEQVCVVCAAMRMKRPA